MGESPEDLGLQEPDEPRATRRPLREIDESRPALLERKLLAFRSAEETREERAEHRLVTDDGDRRLSRLMAEGSQNRVDATVSEGRLFAGLESFEGSRGDVGGGARARKRARQQHVGPVGYAGQPGGGDTELGCALGREGTVVIGNAGRAAGDSSGVANASTPQAIASSTAANSAANPPPSASDSTASASITRPSR